jgi:hypothetical protein
MENKKHHPTTIKKSEEYANTDFNYGEFEELQYEFGEPIGVPTDDKEFVKRAYLAGYAEARENSRLSWQDISNIIRISFSMYPNLREIDYDSDSVFQKIANKANKEKFGRHYI